jgi:hypothetical protein
MKIFNKPTLIQLLIFCILSVIMNIILDNLNEKTFVFYGILIAFYLFGRHDMKRDISKLKK